MPPRARTAILTSLFAFAVLASGCDVRREDPPADEPRYRPEQVAGAITQFKLDGAKVEDCAVQNVKYLGKGMWLCGTVQFDETTGVIGYMPAPIPSGGGTLQ